MADLIKCRLDDPEVNAQRFVWSLMRARLRFCVFEFRHGAAITL
jgi:hypothetical protein